MRKTRTGLVLSTGWIWAMSLPFRLCCSSREPGFTPGLRNVIDYELARLRHAVFDHERMTYLRESLRMVGLRLRRRA
jgi:hypothetical protein